MCGNTFKHNCNGFCLREQDINILIVYEHTYFSIFITIPLLLIRVRINASHFAIRDKFKRTCDSKKLKNKQIAMYKICGKGKT